MSPSCLNVLMTPQVLYRATMSGPLWGAFLLVLRPDLPFSLPYPKSHTLNYRGGETLISGRSNYWGWALSSLSTCANDLKMNFSDTDHLLIWYNVISCMIFPSKNLLLWCPLPHATGKWVRERIVSILQGSEAKDWGSSWLTQVNNRAPSRTKASYILVYNGIYFSPITFLL